jgi:hypothetical protein
MYWLNQSSARQLEQLYITCKKYQYTITQHKIEHYAKLSISFRFYTAYNFNLSFFILQDCSQEIEILDKNEECVITSG